MTLEAAQVTRRGDQPVPEIRVTLEELMAAHGWLSTTVRNGWGSAPPPFPPAIHTLGGGVGGGGSLLQQRLDQLGEAVARPVEAPLDRPQVAPRDVGDLAVALP